MRPAAFAYLALSLHVVATPDVERAVATAGQELARFAASKGYELAGVFTDVQGRTETGLYAMLTALRRGQAVAVVVPDLGHLRHAGCLAGADLPTATRYLRARLLAMRPNAGGCLDGSRIGDRPGHVDENRATPAEDPASPSWRYVATDSRTGARATPRRSHGAHR